MSEKSSAAFSRSEGTSREAPEEESLFKGYEDLIEEGDKALDVKSIEEEKKAEEEKKKEANYIKFYNRLYFYHEFCQQLDKSGEGGMEAKLNKIGQTMEEEDKGALIKLREHLATQANIRLGVAEELAPLLSSGRKYQSLPEVLQGQIKDYNEAVKEFKLKEQACKDLTGDIGELREKGGKFDKNLLLHKGLNHIEEELVNRWQTKEGEERKEKLRVEISAYNRLGRDLKSRELRFTPQERGFVKKGVVLSFGPEKEAMAPLAAEEQKKVERKQVKKPSFLTHLSENKEQMTILAPYQKDVNRMREQLQNIARNYPVLKIDFTAEDYWRDYAAMMEKRGQLEEECGFSVTSGNAGNWWRAMRRGKTKIYGKLKSQYEQIVNGLEGKNKFLEQHPEKK